MNRSANGLFCLFVSAVAGAAETPEALRAPADQKLLLQANASGVQIYECKANKDNASQFEWVLKAPEADLVDASGRKVARHYAGPTWEANDGSKVVGEVKAKDNGPDTNAIAWLLLTAKSHAGAGVFANVQTIQRLHTEGGKAPAQGCTSATAGTSTRVPYKATYYFYGVAASSAVSARKD
ncbi:MAG TPA: DUF3455 domain-containing protein [Rudaea sp.]